MPLDIENEINRNIFSNTSEKSFIDKVLAKSDTDAIRELIKKKELNREELLEILYLIAGTESKLLNYGEWERYIILKFFVWIREFTKIMELMYDYEDRIKENAERKNNPIILSPSMKLMFKNVKLKMSHNAKFLIDLYLNIGRTSLSLGATGIMELIKNKFEISYPQMNQQIQSVEHSRLFGLGKKSG